MIIELNNLIGVLQQHVPIRPNDKLPSTSIYIELDHGASKPANVRLTYRARLGAMVIVDLDKHGNAIGLELLPNVLALPQHADVIHTQ